jgi:hypothetical protein
MIGAVTKTAGFRRSIVVALCAATAMSAAAAAKPLSGRAAPQVDRPTLADAQELFYNAHYEAAAAMTLALQAADPDNLANDELRTSALLFELKALLEGTGEKDGAKEKAQALSRCAVCPDLVAAFVADTRRGQVLARAALGVNPNDETALFFLGKIDLNYVWLQLGPLGRRTGWDEYWEARRSLDAVLKSSPRNVRALVARAWIDYVVDTKMPWGTRWVLGGGSRKRGVATVREAAGIPSEFFTHAEAEFALWNMQVRERDFTPATEVARRLAHDFPDNREVAAFLDAHDSSARR